MRIGLHSQPSGTVPGGSEFTIAVLAESLSKTHEVEIVHHRHWLDRAALESFTGLNLERVTFRYTPEVCDAGITSLNPRKRYEFSREAGRAVSEPYDCFVNFTHGMPPYCHARYGVIVVLFPLVLPFYTLPWPLRRRPWDQIRSAYSFFEWRARTATYSAVVSISKYTQTWTRNLWRLESEVVYPPCPSAPLSGPKTNLVLSVGRFTSGGHRKCQLEMARAFAQIGLKGWRYATVGPVGDHPEDHRYYEDVVRAAHGSPISVEENLSRPALMERYRDGAIFWHAAGLDNAAGAPDENEHFGISTVEAMAAGCVPIVINRGGQPEIVEHGVSGFLWNTLDDLQRYTQIVAHDHNLRRQMSEAARRRAAKFDRRAFLEGMAIVIERARARSLDAEKSGAMVRV